jgi:hypothetical protein
MTTPDWLRRLIAESGMSQREAAQAIGISPRMMRYHLAPEGTSQHRPAPPAVVLAIEYLAWRERTFESWFASQPVDLPISARAVWDAAREWPKP